MKHYLLALFLVITFLLEAKEAPVVLVTDSSEGLGYTVTQHLLKKGYTVYATVQELSAGDRLKETLNEAPGKLYVKYLDLHNENSIAQVVNEITLEEERIDILINHAGWGFKDKFNLEEAQEQFDNNFFGMLRVTQATLPLMRAQREGKIINISSFNADYPLAGWNLYTASKQAVELVSATMANSLNTWNIRLSVIESEPQNFQKSPISSMHKLYKNVLESSKKWFKKYFQGKQENEHVVQLIDSIIENEQSKFLYHSNPKSEELALNDERFPPLKLPPIS